MRRKYILTDAKAKFKNVRETLPNLDEEAYQLTDFISEIITDNVTPQGLMAYIILIYNSLLQNKNYFNNHEILTYDLYQKRTKYLEEMPNITAIVDNIAPKNFSDTFRKLTQNFLVYNFDKTYPENVKAAVNWWEEAIKSSNFSDIDLPLNLQNMLINNQQELTNEQLNIFKSNLAKEIMMVLREKGVCVLTVDYTPCEILERAGEKVGFDSMLNYPWKTKMIIDNEQVIVSKGIENSPQIIWSNNNYSKTK